VFSEETRSTASSKASVWTSCRPSSSSWMTRAFCDERVGRWRRLLRRGYRSGRRLGFRRLLCCRSRRSFVMSWVVVWCVYILMACRVYLSDGEMMPKGCFARESYT